MIGQVYFDRTFSETYVPLLDAVYDNPATVDKLWEHIYLDNIKQLDMVARRYPAGTIFEFDSLDEVREFDPLFLENLDSEVFDNIVTVLGCDKGSIRDVYPLKQGLTNLSCHFATDDGELRLPPPRHRHRGHRSTAQARAQPRKSPTSWGSTTPSSTRIPAVGRSRVSFPMPATSIRATMRRWPER